MEFLISHKKRPDSWEIVGSMSGGGCRREQWNRWDAEFAERPRSITWWTRAPPDLQREFAAV